MKVLYAHQVNYKFIVGFLSSLSIGFFSLSVYATELSLEGDYSNSISTNILSADSDLDLSPPQKKGLHDKDIKLPFGLFAGSSKSTSTDSTGASVVDKSTLFGGNLGLDFNSKWTLDFSYSYTDTPDENLTIQSPNFSVGYNYFFDSTKAKKPDLKSKTKDQAKLAAKNKKTVDDDADEDSEEDTEDSGESFKKSIGIRLGFLSSKYTQIYSTLAASNPRRIARKLPQTGTNEIQQTGVKIELPIRLLSWMKVKPAYTKYKFDRDVVTFMQTLDSKLISASRASFGTTVSGLADFETSLEISFYILSSWELMLYHSRAQMAYDSSTSLYSKLEIFYEWSDWRLGIGASSQDSLGTQTKSALLNLSYNF